MDLLQLAATLELEDMGRVVMRDDVPPPNGFEDKDPGVDFTDA